MADERFGGVMAPKNGEALPEGSAEKPPEGGDAAGIWARPATAQDEGRGMKLLPCPFCGGQAAVARKHFAVYCVECGAEAAKYTSDEAAIKGWNSRVPYVHAGQTHVSEVPGITAKHAIITSVCRENRGVDGAFDEAAMRLRDRYIESLKKNPSAKYHVVLTVERT